jgi:hypothetical protein
VNGTGDDRERRARQAKEERERIRQAFPSEFNDGAKRAFEGSHLYPPGFQAWPLERRNAWFAGFNFGYGYRNRGGGGDAG